MKEGSLFWAPDGSPRFPILTLVSIFPLMYTGHYHWALTALFATFLIACCNAMDDLDVETKTDIRLNVMSPEDILHELEKDTREDRTTIVATGLRQLSQKYHKQSTRVTKQQKNAPPVAVPKEQIQRFEELALLSQQAAYVALHQCPHDDTVVAGSISLLALIAKHEAVRERHVQQADVYGLDVPMRCIRNALERARHSNRGVEESNACERFDDMSVAQQQAELQRKACLWLGALAGGLNDLVLQEGGLEILLNAAGWYRNHSEVVNWALWAMFELCQDNVKRKAALVELNGVTRILQAMETTVTESVEVARHGLAIIFDIMRTDPQEFIVLNGPLIDMNKVKNAALNAGIHSICLAAMKSYSDKPEIMMLGQALLVGTSYGGEIPTFTGPTVH
jgi:Arc/MetJ-type ribon-helix-helix transcriptional regulator